MQHAQTVVTNVRVRTFLVAPKGSAVPALIGVGAVPNIVAEAVLAVMIAFGRMCILRQLRHQIG